MLSFFFGSCLARLLNDARQSQLKDPTVTLITSGESLLDVRLKDQLVAVATVPKTSEERLLLVGGPKGILSSMSYFRVRVFSLQLFFFFINLPMVFLHVVG